MLTPDNPQYKDRVAKAEKWRGLGVDPFGTSLTGIMEAEQARALHKGVDVTPHDGADAAKVAGRILLLRDTGKLIFLTIQDWTGRLQIALSKKSVEAQWEQAKLLELGDIAWFSGKIGHTKTGEVTMWAEGFGLASKAMLPPPDKFHGLTDTESRYRQRYVDLFANPDSMKIFLLRSKAVALIRSFLMERGYVEVETPMMQSLAGGAAARPFTTHHNALDIPLFLRIAPELFLKRLLVGGYSKVFELNRNFRNEGISPRHNPEFTMLEAYEAFGSWESMADMVESMICHLAEKLLGTLKIEHKNAEGVVTKTINLERPWRRVRMVDLVKERTGWAFDKRPLQEVAPEVIEKLKEKGQTRVMDFSPAEQLVEVYEKLIEHTLVDPCFVTHVPSVIIPLAKENKEDSFFADVYELAINGQEISPGYSELNDPEVQAKHFMHQVGDTAEQQKFDEDFINALRYGMPPAGGIGLGIDRLVMMLTGSESIRDVVLFPLLKPLASSNEPTPPAAH